MEHDEEIRREFLTFYEAHMDAIFRHCFYRLSNRELAKDLMQEAFMRLWQSLAQGTLVLSMRSFTYRVANNLIVDHYRKKKEFSLEALQDDGFEPAHNSEKEVIHEKLDALEVLQKLDLLEAPFRDVIVMRYIDDLTPKEIAEISGETENVVSVRLNRALKKIRNLTRYE